MTTRLGPNETEVRGRWIGGGRDHGRPVEDESCRRVWALVDDGLVRAGADSSGWNILHIDPSDGRYWELSFPESSRHGGGPPALAVISRDDAERRYGVAILARKLVPRRSTDALMKRDSRDDLPEHLGSIRHSADLGRMCRLWLQPESEGHLSCEATIALARLLVLVEEARLMHQTPTPIDAWRPVGEALSQGADEFVSWWTEALSDDAALPGVGQPTPGQFVHEAATRILARLTPVVEALRRSKPATDS